MSRARHRDDNEFGRSGEHDLYGVSERIADHVTDEIFNHLIQSREGTETEELRLVEDLDEDLKKAIKSKLIPQICEAATRRIGERVEADLREQYHAGGRYEAAADKVVSGARWIMAAVYMLLSASLLSILVFTFVDTKNLLEVSSCYLEESLRGRDPLECAKVKELMRKSGYSVEGDEEDTEQASAASGRPDVTAAPTQPDGAQPNSKKPATKGMGRKAPDSLTLVIAPVVKLLDLVLIGSLVVMVLIGGYENTVSRIGMKHSLPVWLGKLTISELKVKVAASIVIISSIHLLMEFLKLDFPKPNFLPGGSAGHGADDWKLYLPLIMTSVIHLVFIFSALAITHINRLEAASHANNAH